MQLGHTESFFDARKGFNQLGTSRAIYITEVCFWRPNPLGCNQILNKGKNPKATSNDSPKLNLDLISSKVLLFSAAIPRAGQMRGNEDNV